jgi:hypothetical protein
MRATEGSSREPPGEVFQLWRQGLEASDELEIEVARTAITSALFSGVAVQPATVGRYVLRQRLGAGGMGIVFAAHDPSLKRDLAIKLLHPRTRDPREDHLLLREAQSTAGLVHPALVTIYDVGLHEGRVFIAMEQIAGPSMQEWLFEGRPWRHSVAVLARAARGIEAAHARGIIHRDFKPANVLLGRDGRVCIADFGLAQQVMHANFTPPSPSYPRSYDAMRALTQSRRIAGTPAYMAPEQYLGTVQDERTDQFAFCASLYEAVFGQKPFEAATIDALKEAVLTSQPIMPPRDDVPASLIDAVSRGLSKDRRDRFANMGELASLLESLSEHVDLARVLGDGARAGEADCPQQTARKPGEGATISVYEAYLRQLPEGLDTALEQRLPSKIYQVILANRPLRNPPGELVPIMANLASQSTMPAVHARAILSAVYDEHFRSLDAWRLFFGETSRSAVKLLATSFALARPSSVHFIHTLAGAYNSRAQGVRIEIIDDAPGTATLRIHFAPHTLNEVSWVAWEEFIRAVMLGGGCRLADLRTLSRDESSFLLRAHWR